MHSTPFWIHIRRVEEKGTKVVTVRSPVNLDGQDSTK